MQSLIRQNVENRNLWQELANVEWLRKVQRFVNIASEFGFFFFYHIVITRSALLKQVNMSQKHGA